MKSPFPGMDPYLESRWGDVHNRLISSISAALQPNLPEGLRARGEQDIRLEDQESPEAGLVFEGDIAVVDTRPSKQAWAAESGGISILAEPLVIEIKPAIRRHKWIQIVDTRDGNRVVTVIEILGPGNKSSGELSRSYRRKLREYARAGVNIVEIDLLRSRRSRLIIKSDAIPHDHRTAYYTCVHRAKKPGKWTVYPMPLRSPLPPIAIPCRPADPDVRLELQPVLERVYREGGHDDIDYTKPPEPPFGPDDAAWAAECVRAARPCVR
jgi:hypothetical protein